MLPPAAIATAAAAAFALALAGTAAWVRLRPRTAPDIHKDGRPLCADGGGLVVAGAAGTVLAALWLAGSPLSAVLLGVLALAAAVGALDDARPLPPVPKLLLAALPALPLLPGSPGPLAAVFVLLALTIASNATNMLAGFNGLEAGSGALALGFLALHAPSVDLAAALAAHAAALLGFLAFNRCPARVFPGDVGTLPVGAVMVAAAALGTPPPVVLILLLPQLADAGLKLATLGVTSRERMAKTTVVAGRLVAPTGHLCLAGAVLRLRRFSEGQLVAVLWGLQALAGAATLLAA